VLVEVVLVKIMTMEADRVSRSWIVFRRKRYSDFWLTFLGWAMLVGFIDQW